MMTMGFLAPVAGMRNEDEEVEDDDDDEGVLLFPPLESTVFSLLMAGTDPLPET